MAGNKKLEFIFRLVDKVSSPSAKMEKSLRKLQAAMGDTATAATKLSKGLSKISFVEKGVGRASRSLRSAKKETSGWSMALQGIDAGLNIFSRVTSMATGTASAITSIGISTVDAIAKIQMFGLEAADFKERSLIGFKTFLGGDIKKAEELFKTAMEFARKTPFETQDTIGLFQQLATAGFKFNKNSLGISEIEVAAKAVGDLVSVKGGGAELMGRVTKAFSQIKSLGKLRAEELHGQLGDAGLNIGKVYEILGKRLGKTRTEIEKLMRAGKIDADTGIYAIIESMKETTSGGQLGRPMDELSHTLTGLWSTIKSAPFDMLKDLDKTLGFKQAKGFFSNLQKALDPSSGPGKRVKARMEKLFDDMFGFTFGGLSGSDGADKLATFMERAADIFEAGWKGIKGITTKIIDETTSYLEELGGGDIGKGLQAFTDKIVSGIGNAATGLSKLVPAMTAVFELIISAAEKVGLIDTKAIDTDEERIAAGKRLGINVSELEWANNAGVSDAFFSPMRAMNLNNEREVIDAAIRNQNAYQEGTKMGQNLGLGFQDGILKNMNYWEAAQYAMEYATEKAKQAAQIQSPSKVFEYFGLMTAKGFSEGVESGQSTAEEKIQNLMSARSSPFDVGGSEVNASSSSSFAGRSVSIGNVSVTVESSAQNDPQGTANAVAEILPEALLETIERILLEKGS